MSQRRLPQEVTFIGRPKGLQELAWSGWNGERKRVRGEGMIYAKGQWGGGLLTLRGREEIT